MAGGGPGLPRRPATDVRSALSPRSDMQVDYPRYFFLSIYFLPVRHLCKLLIGFPTNQIIFQHKMHNVVDYVLGAPGPGPKVAGIENNIAR